MSNPKTRQATIELHRLMDDGVLTPRQVANACLHYMSEYDVADMASCEGFIEEEEEEEEQEDEEEQQESDETEVAPEEDADGYRHGDIES